MSRLAIRGTKFRIRCSYVHHGIGDPRSRHKRSIGLEDSKAEQRLDYTDSSSQLRDLRSTAPYSSSSACMYTMTLSDL
jgi:hypothetical protein